jgi:hypothetical protein
LYGKDTVVALPDFERDLKQLREKIDMLLRFRLLGGEPLLVPNVGEYIEVARRIFPESEIEVVTNGLPLPNMEKSFFDAVRKNEVMISISAYKPTMKIKDGIISVLSRYNVMFRFTNDNIDVFHRNLTLKKIHDESVSWKKCNSSRCIFFRHGKIYKCPIAGMIKEFGEHYNVPFEVDDGIDIYEDALDTCEKVKRLALHPVEACKYCAEDMELIPWQTLNKPELKDWLYHDGENA